MSRILSEMQCRVMEALGGREEPVEVRALAEQLVLNQSPVTAAALELAEQGWVSVEEQ